MSFFEIFDSLAKAIGKSVNSVAKDIGVASGTVTAWKQGTVPSAEKIELLADYFGVSADYLLGREKPEHPPLTDGEKSLLASYKELDDAGRAKVAEYAALLKGSMPRTPSLTTLDGTASKRA